MLEDTDEGQLDDLDVIPNEEMLLVRVNEEFNLKMSFFFRSLKKYIYFRFHHLKYIFFTFSCWVSGI